MTNNHPNTKEEKKIRIRVRTTIRGNLITLMEIEIKPISGMTYDLLIDPPHKSDFWAEVKRIYLENSDGVLETLVKKEWKL